MTKEESLENDMKTCRELIIPLIPLGEGSRENSKVIHGIQKIYLWRTSTDTIPGTIQTSDQPCCCDHCSNSQYGQCHTESDWSTSVVRKK